MAATAALVALARRLGTDHADLEIKAAAGGLPKTTVETISAFANGRGGTLVLGLSEDDGFAPAPGFDAARISDALAGSCADRLDPPIRASVVTEEFEDALVVRVDVPELDPRLKPCFVKDRGPYQGSFIRGGDGDRRLNSYEVTQLLSNRGHPADDKVLVAQASLADLDPDLVTALVNRVRARSQRAFARLDDEGVLVRLGAARDTDAGLRPTLAGLLCLGIYPQQFFPQLFISFVAVPGRTIGEQLPDGRRFLDNQSIDGPIPLMVQEAVNAVERNMRRAALVTGVGRTDHYDYPVDVIRELVVNALMHRDYSGGSLGTQVQVELYPDRLVVKSPGGLYGSVDVSQLGTENATSSRNALLARLLAEVPVGTSGEVVCENRGSGIPTVLRSLRDAGMSPPEFDAAPGHVFVTVPQHALLDPAVVAWIGSLGVVGLNDAQHLALAMMHVNGSVTNAMLRLWGVERQTATQALADLVGRGLATKSGGRRYASYELIPLDAPADLFSTPGPVPEPKVHLPRVETELAAVLEAVRAGYTTSRAIAAQLGLSYQTTLRRIRVLRESGRLEETTLRHSRAQSYRLAPD